MVYFLLLLGVLGSAVAPIHILSLLEPRLKEGLPHLGLCCLKAEGNGNMAEPTDSP